MINSTITDRGFKLLTFTDRYGANCSLQESSLTTENAIWLGVDDVNPLIMCKDAVKLGLRDVFGDERDNGCCKYEIPDAVLLTTRMHLTQAHVKELLPILKKFAKTGEI